MITLDENNNIDLDKTKENLNLFNLLSEDFPNGSWHGRVILEIKKEGNVVFLQTSKIKGWKAVLLDKIKAFFGINSNSHLPAIVEFLRKHQTPINLETLKIINNKIANHNGKKINQLFKRMIPLLVQSSIIPHPVNTPQIISQKEPIEKISMNMNSQEAAICLNKCFDVIAKTLEKKGQPEAKTFLNGLEGKADVEKANAIREWMNASQEQLSKITELKLIGLELTNLPSEIGKLQNLTNLSLEYNQLTSLPVEIGQLQNLTNLFLNNNQLTSLPAAIGQLQNLSVLGISHNQLTSLPPEIVQLQNLDYLNLERNKLESLPTEIVQLENLDFLNLEHNKLESLPTEVVQLKNLKQLHLYRNQLTNLPPEIGKLQNLTELDLSHNQLTSLPPEIGKLQNLETIILYNNKLTSLPTEILNSSNPNIAQNEVVLKFSKKS